MVDRRSSAEHAGQGAVVVIPTYNERDNLAAILWRLHEACPAAHALVVDDGSPDGTGVVAEELAAADDRVHTMHRRRKAGLGAAYVAGFEWALARDYRYIIEMDADGSHDPAQLPRMLRRVETSAADVVLGSRYVSGGRVANWSWYRQWLSRSANRYSRIVLGVAINDMTSGFRVYQRRVLNSLDLGHIASEGYCFQVDLTWRSVAAGFVVAEVPITFVEREVGMSKMSGAIVREALLRITAWGLRRRVAQLRAVLRR